MRHWQVDLVLTAHLGTNVQLLVQQVHKSVLMVLIQVHCGKVVVQFVKEGCHVLARQIVHSANGAITVPVER